MGFYRFTAMDLIEKVPIFGLLNIHTFEPNIRLIRLFSIIFNCAKLRISESFR